MDTNCCCYLHNHNDVEGLMFMVIYGFNLKDYITLKSLCLCLFRSYR